MPPKNKSVLVVDDEPTIRGLVRRILERNGMAVVEAVDGLDALNLLKTLRPDLILSDIKMPRMNGISLRAAVAEKLPEVPVVMMSGYASDPEVSAVQQAGTPFILKPFVVKTLVEIVERHLNNRTQRGTAVRSEDLSF